VAEFNAGSIEADLTVDKDPFIQGLEEAMTWAKGITKDPLVERLNLDSSTALAQLGATIAMMQSALAAADLTAKVGIDTGASSAAATGAVADAAAAGGGGGGAGIGSLLAGAFMGGGGGGGGGGNIFGRIPGLGALNVLPKLGGAGWLAGLGPERILTSGLGIAGSAVGGAIGGGILGAGALATAGVGMGTDLAGLGQAVGDAQKYATALDALNKAIAVYGAGSTEAVHAQNALNYAVSQFPAVAAPAIIALNTTTTQFKNMFDQLTGPAEKTGAEILTQMVQVGEKFLPIIGKYASENMLIIQKALQPLFTWMQGPGLKIFTDFEKMFQEHLPTAMHIFVQGVELIIKMLDYAAQHTGGFLTTIDKLVTKFNTPAGTEKWHKEFDNLFSLFHTWLGLFDIMFKDIYQFFNLSAGQGQAFAKTLTGMLQQLHDYLTSTSGKAAVHNLFEAHKNELIAMLKLLPTVIGTFGQIELAFGPAFTNALTIIVKIIDAILKIPLIGPILADVAAFAFIFNKMGLLPTVVKALEGLGKALFYLSTEILWPIIANGLIAISAGLEAIGISLDATGVGEILLALALLGLAAYEIVKHWSTVKQWFDDFWKWMHGSWGQAIAALLVVLDPFLGIPLEIALHWKGIVGFFEKLWRDVKTPFEDFWHWMHGWMGTVILGWLAFSLPFIAIPVFIALHWRGLITFFKDLWETIKKDGHTFALVAVDIFLPFIGIPLTIIGHWRGLLTFFKGLWKDMKDTWDVAWGWIKDLGNDIASVFEGAPSWLLQVGKDILNGLWDGLKWVWNNIIWPFFSNIPKVVKNVFLDAPGWLLQAGKDILQGLWTGITWIWDNVIWKFFTGFPTAIKDAVEFTGKAITWLVQVGKDVISGLFNGITDALKDVWNWVNNNIVQPIINAVLHFFGIKSPSTVMAELGRNTIEGFIQGLMSRNWVDVAKKIFGDLPTALAHMVAKGLISLDQIPGEILTQLAKVPGIGIILGPIAGGVTSATNLFNSILSGGISLANSLSGHVLSGFGSLLSGIAGALGLGGGAAPAGAATGSIQAQMQAAAAARGWTGAEWTALYNVEKREANFDPNARNPSSGAYGLAQGITGPSWYAQYGGDLSPQGQIRAMLNYITQRYGSPQGAWTHEQKFGWYDAGGVLPPGLTMALNTTGRNEYVSPMGGYNGPMITIEHVTFQDQTDMKAFMNMADFYMAQRKAG
jgi:hypothetical protein